MSSIQRLQAVVRDEIRRQKHIKAKLAPAEVAWRFGQFVKAAMVGVNLDTKMLADKLRTEPDVVEALLAGTLPVDEIDATLLKDLARALDHDVNTLRVMVGAAPLPDEHDARA